MGPACRRLPDLVESLDDFLWGNAPRHRDLVYLRLKAIALHVVNSFDCLLDGLDAPLTVHSNLQLHNLEPWFPESRAGELNSRVGDPLCTNSSNSFQVEMPGSLLPGAYIAAPVPSSFLQAIATFVLHRAKLKHALCGSSHEVRHFTLEKEHRKQPKVGHYRNRVE